MTFYEVRICLNPETLESRRFYRGITEASSAVRIALRDCGDGLEAIEFKGTTYRSGAEHYEHWQSVCGQYVIILETRTFESAY